MRTHSGRSAIATWLSAAIMLLAACKGVSVYRADDRHSAAQSHNPRRIISLVPAVTEMLFAIGAGDRVIAVSSFDHYPPAVEGRQRVGGLLDPDVERIITLRPDLAIVAKAQEDLIAKLNQAGIPAYVYSIGGVDQVMRTLREVGRATGLESSANAEAARLQAELEAIRNRVAGEPRPRTLLIFGREPGALRAIDASGGVGFLHDLMEIAGGNDVFGNEKRESLRVSTEGIIAAAPDVILELHYGASLATTQLAAERAVWNILPAVPAVRTGRVYLFGGDEFVIPGMRMVSAAEAFAEAIHPGR